jgi:hypothetical protein
MSSGDFGTGTVAGVVAAVLWAAFIWLYRRWRLNHNFRRMTGMYRVTRKHANKSEQELVAIEVKGNVLSVSYENLPNGGAASGQIVMNEELRTSGAGHYEHLEDGVQMWGFYDVQLKDENTILVHVKYASHTEHREVVSGFVWSRIASSGP